MVAEEFGLAELIRFPSLSSEMEAQFMSASTCSHAWLYWDAWSSWLDVLVDIMFYCGVLCVLYMSFDFKSCITGGHGSDDR